MFYRYRINHALAFVLLASLVVYGPALTGARAQGQQQQQTPPAASQQEKSRPRRAGEETPQPQPTPAAPSDDVTLQDDDEVVRVDTNLTNILFTAVDKQKRFITTLRREDIRILEDGQPQEIFTFQQQADLPLSLAIVIDTSVSEEMTLPTEKEAATAFVDAVIRPSKDEAAVLTFTGETTLELGLTGSIPRIRRALNRVEFVAPSGYIGGGATVGIGTPPISDTQQNIAGSTAVWDAVWVTADEVLSETSDKTRRAIILLTDGVDSSSQKKMDEAVEQAIKRDVLIYSIGIGDDYRGGINKDSLRKVSERTGGRAFFPEDDADLRAAFAQIQRELREQYLIAYSPTNKNRDGTFRRVLIEVTNPELRKQNLKLTYRQGYFARTPGAVVQPAKPRRKSSN
ncbi:MAG TPA: VWA domain-containing protein [Pyrinomonadaceae bacterium]